jgi:hypothetical protein
MPYVHRQIVVNKHGNVILKTPNAEGDILANHVSMIRPDDVMPRFRYLFEHLSPNKCNTEPYSGHLLNP